MSTRSIILVKGKGRYDENIIIRLYKHSDGYPTENLPLIFNTLKTCLNIVIRKKCFYPFLYKHFNPEFFAYKLMGKSVTIYGKGAHIDKFENDPGEYDSEFKLEHLGNQFDLEWIYIVDLEQKSVNVYGGGYSGKEPQIAFKRGFVDPESYSKQLYEEYQSSEIKKIKQYVKDIELLGFKVNKIKDKVSKPKKIREK